MNILYIDHYAGGLSFGMEFRPYYLGREWIKKGHKVRVLGSDFSHLRTANPVVKKDFQIDVVDGLEYQWIKSGIYQGNGVKRAISIFKFSYKLYIHAQKIAKECHPDVVISSSTYPLDTYGAQEIVKWENKKRYNNPKKDLCKYVHEGHDLWPLTLTEIGGMSKYHPFVLLMGMAERAAYRNASLLVSVLPGIMPHLLERGFDKNKQQFLPLPNGIVQEDWNNVHPLNNEVAQPLKRLKNEDKFIVGYIGGHAISNALDVLVEAARLCNEDNVVFVLVGKGTEKKHLQELARGGDNIFFLPAVPKTQVPAALEFFDALYVGAKPCSIYRYGVSMNKMYDYMMSGKPIINGVKASNNDVAAAQCGITIEPESSDAIIKAVNDLKELSVEDRVAMGLRGRKWVLENAEYGVLASRFLNSMLSI